MATALWIAHVKVTDEAAYMEYASRATGAIADHGGDGVTATPDPLVAAAVRRGSVRSRVACGDGARATLPRGFPPAPVPVVGAS